MVLSTPFKAKVRRICSAVVLAFIFKDCIVPRQVLAMKSRADRHCCFAKRGLTSFEQSDSLCMSLLVQLRLAAGDESDAFSNAPGPFPMYN